MKDKTKATEKPAQERTVILICKHTDRGVTYPAGVPFSVSETDYRFLKEQNLLAADSTTEEV